MADRVPVQIKRLPHGEGLALPAYATGGAAGMDVLSAEDFAIARGDRIAQLVLAPVTLAAWHEVDVLDDTARGAGGFGSTGGHARLV